MAKGDKVVSVHFSDAMVAKFGPDYVLEKALHEMKQAFGPKAAAATITITLGSDAPEGSLSQLIF